MNKLIYKTLHKFWPINESLEYDVYLSVRDLYKYTRNNLLLLSIFLFLNFSVKSYPLYHVNNIGNITIVTVLTFPLAIVIGVGVGTCISAGITKLEEIYFLQK
jgi:hypothetical protein